MCTLKEIREELEEEKHFKYWNKAIGLTFDDFSIIDIDKGFCVKQGKIEIGRYYIYLQDGTINSFGFDMNNEHVRMNTLKIIGL